MDKMPNWKVRRASIDIEGRWEITLDTGKTTDSTFTADVVEQATGKVVGKLTIEGYPNPVGNPRREPGDD